MTNGLAFRKFSGSVKMLGANRTRMKNRDRAITYPSRSLIE